MTATAQAVQVSDPDHFLACLDAIEAGKPVAELAEALDQRKGNLERSLERYAAQSLFSTDPLAVTERGRSLAAFLRGKGEAPEISPGASPDASHAIEARQVRPSPLNPRKTFDEEAIDQLARSLREKGQLQPGVVRPHPDGEGYEIAAGEMRWRAVNRNIELGHWPEDAPYHAMVRELTDADLLEIALIENHRRVNPPAHEEAEGFRQYAEMRIKDGADPDKITGEIAEAIGATKRTVQIRLRLAKELHPKAMAIWKKDAITLAQAEAIVRWPKESQPAAAANAAEGYDRWGTEKGILEMLKEKGMAAKHALFNLDFYGAGCREEIDGEEWLTDRARAEQMQRKAVETKLKELRKKPDTAFAETEDCSWNPIGTNGRHGKPKKNGKDGYLVVVDPRTLAVSVHRCSKIPKASVASKDKDAAGAEEPPSLAYERRNWKSAKVAKSRALQKALAEAPPEISMALTIIALLSDDYVIRKTVKISRDRPTGDEHEVKAFNVKPALKECGLELSEIAEDPAKALQTLMQHKLKIPRLFAAVIAAQTASWPSYDAIDPGDRPLTLDLAFELKLDHAGPLDDKAIERMTLAQMEAHARAAGVEMPIAKKKKDKAAQLALALAGADYVPPENRFGSPDDIAAAVDEVLQAKP